MKILHSYWSKPVEATTSKAAGWLTPMHHYMSWALSCLTIKKVYGYVELYTDDVGKEILIDLINLPYDKVDLSLNNIILSKLFWVAGKLKALEIQKEPFIHIDGDVYVWARIEEKLSCKDLISQNEEKFFTFYDKPWQDFKENFVELPSFLLNDYEKNKGIIAYNLGVVGGNNYSFYKDYSQLVLNFLYKNNNRVDKFDNYDTALIYEQYVYGAYARLNKRKISKVFSKVGNNYRELGNCLDVPKDSYIHFLGSAKKQLNCYKFLENRLRYEFPDYYYHIINLTKEGLI